MSIAPHMRSIATQVIAVLVAATTFLLGILGVTYYFYEKNQKFQLLRNDLAVTADQLAAGLTDPVWDCDDILMGKILDSAFMNSRIYGVVLTANGEKQVRVRDARWRVAASDQEFSDSGLLVADREIQSDAETIGSLKVFASPVFIREGMKEAIVLIVSVIFIVDLILISSLYTLIWRMMLKPIRAIERYAVASSDGEGTGVKIGGAVFYGELDSLRAAIEKMVILLNERYAEIQRSARALQRSRDFLDNIIEHIPAMIFLKDAENLRFLKFNKAGEDLLGYSREELIGKTDYDFFPEREADFFTQKDREVLSGGCLVEIPEETVQTRHHGERVLRTRKIPLMDTQGVPRYLLGISEDITDRKRAEAENRKLQDQLAQAQKMESVGRLAGGVAHDFNNMLSIMIGYAELALDQIPTTAPLHGNIQEIITAGQRSAEVVRQLLAFARKQTISPQVLDLNHTVSGMLKMLRRLIGENITLDWKPARGLWPVKMDPSQVDQILANLMVNARDAIRDVGNVAIETGNSHFNAADCETCGDAASGDYVTLTVSDDGCGMDRKTQTKIFEPFFTTKEMGKGTGLGLATIYGIVKQNDGFIEVNSEPGQGSTFTIHIPRYRLSEGADDGAPVSMDVPVGAETILLVEDEPVVLALGETMLGRLGYTVMTARTPGQAIRLAGEHPGDIHLLMTDVVMPEMNGRDLAERLISLRPNLKCLFMSGYTANVIAHHGVLDAGVTFIEKPFSAKELALKVREALA